MEGRREEEGGTKCVLRESYCGIREKLKNKNSPRPI